MSTRFSYAPLQVPEDWTPEEALTVYEYLTQMSDALWERYAVELLPLLRPDPDPGDSIQLDLFDPNDELPF